MTNVQVLVELTFGVDTYDPTEEYMLTSCLDFSSVDAYDIFSSACIMFSERST